MRMRYPGYNATASDDLREDRAATPDVGMSEFMQAVVHCAKSVRAVSDAEMDARFRSSRSFRDFISLARLVKGVPLRVLAVGCGQGLGGRPAQYAASVIREISPGANITSADLVGRRGVAGPLALTGSRILGPFSPGWLFLLDALAQTGGE
jgi:hypothetical protein